jgi:hypothetical protein
MEWEYANEPPGSIKREPFVDLLSDYQVFRMNLLLEVNFSFRYFHLQCIRCLCHSILIPALVSQSPCMRCHSYDRNSARSSYYRPECLLLGGGGPAVMVFIGQRYIPNPQIIHPKFKS